MHAMKANFVPMKFALALRGAALLLALLLGAPLAQALQSDRKQPLNVVAGAMHYDDIAQATVFTGGVVMTKGSLVLHAQRVRVRQHADGYDEATAYGSASQPATFDQTLDAAPGQPVPTVHGSALTLHYDGRTDIVTLTGQALLERSLDGHLSDRAQGAVITYNDLTDVFNVQAGKAGATPGNPQGRVRVMLSPRAASPAAAPRAAAASTPSLRSSPGLEPRK
jgi:lipopolysaccharide export system protein LptA